MVDPHEELGAVTLLASRQDKSPALIFEKMQGDTTGSRILTNMLGASRERYALAVGLDPSASTPEMVQATRSIMNQPIPPVMIPSARAPVNELVLTGKDIDLTKFPFPTFWPGDGGPFIGTDDVTFTASPDTGRINVCCRLPTVSACIVHPANMGCSTVRLDGRAASRARWLPRTASILCFSCWRRRASPSMNPSSVSPVASRAGRSN